MIEVTDILKALNVTADDVVSRVADNLRSEFEGSVGDLFRSEVAKLAQKAAPAIIESHLNLAVDNIINGSYQPVNEWGEPQGKSTSLRALVQSRCVKYLDEKVDARGNTTNYSPVGTRGEYLAREAAQKAVDSEAKSQLTSACEAAKSEIKKLVAQHIATLLLK